MRNILFYIATFCFLSQAFAADRQLDSTLLVTKEGLTVRDGTAPVEFKCGTEWSVVFTENGQTATLHTQEGHWTLTGLSSEVAVAAVSEGAPLVSGIAGALGVSDVEDVTSRTIALASSLAHNIGQPTFDAALVVAVDAANDVLDDNGIHPIDFNDEILTAITLLGPSGGVIDASDVTVEEVHRDATKTIGLVLNALASSGAIHSAPQQPAGGDAAAAAAAAAAAGADASQYPGAGADAADVVSIDVAAVAAAAAAAAAGK